MFVRWTTRSRAGRQGTGPDQLITAVLVKAVRIEGQPRQKAIAYLASIRSGDLKFLGSRIRFWNTADARLDKLALSAEERQKIEAALAARVPLPPQEEREANKRQFAEWHAQMNALSGVATSEPSVRVSLSELETIKSELDRLYQIEAVQKEFVRRSLHALPGDEPAQRVELLQAAALFSVQIGNADARDAWLEMVRVSVDVGRGIPEKPVPRPPGRPLEPSGKWLKRAKVCVALAGLVQAELPKGLPKREAARRVALAKEKHAKYLARKFKRQITELLETPDRADKPELWSTILRWEEKLISRNSRAAKEAVDYYAFLLPKVQNDIDAAPENERRSLAKERSKDLILGRSS